MSDMSTTASFTLRDLNRQPAKILAAVRKFGSAEIRTRAGEVFTMVPKAERSSRRRTKEFPDFEARWQHMRELGHQPPSASENERLNRIIAGEE